MEMSTPRRPTAGDRVFQCLLILSTLALCWLGMMVVHEFGHALFAWLSHGRVARVVLGPLEFSRTELEVNPHPLVVGWGGALVGVLLPFAVFALWRFLRWPGWWLLQFFAGFCLVANGIYLGVVSFIPNAADPGDIMREGCPHWVLVVFGMVAFPAGLALWNGLGTYFGLGVAGGKVNPRAAVATFVFLLALIGAEFLTYAG